MDLFDIFGPSTGLAIPLHGDHRSSGGLVQYLPFSLQPYIHNFTPPLFSPGSLFPRSGSSGSNVCGAAVAEEQSSSSV